MISLQALALCQQRKLERSSRAQQFRYFCMMMLGAEYELGRENIFATDCSGTICWPLFCIDPERLRLRLTAPELFDELFMGPAMDVSNYYDRVLAVFFQKGGRITHVSPIVGRRAILDAVNPDQPVQIKALDLVAAWYQREGYEVLYKELSWEAAYEVAARSADRWQQEADEVLRSLT